jgi:hypothetical protein
MNNLLVNWTVIQPLRILLAKQVKEIKTLTSPHIFLKFSLPSQILAHLIFPRYTMLPFARTKRANYQLTPKLKF